MPHVHNALHHATRLQDALRVAINESDASFNGLERAGETLTPVLDLWSRPEWALPRGEVWCARKLVVAAGGAGLFASVELVNGAGSGILTVVRAIRATGSGVDISIDSGVALGVVSTNRGIPIDGRFSVVGPASKSTLVVGQLAAGATNAQDIVLGTVSGVESRYPYVLPPGRKLFMVAAAANTGITVTVLFSERLAGDAELATAGL